MNEDRSLYLYNWLNFTHILPEGLLKSIVIIKFQDHQANNFQGLNTLIRSSPEPYSTSNQTSAPDPHYINSIF